MRRLTRPLLIFLALVFLFEAWLWEHLRPVVQWIVRHVAWRAMRERIAAFIEQLSPYPTLLIFLVPIVLLFPIKLFGYWLLAKGAFASAAITLGLAKIVSTGVTAFIFDLTRPKLLQLPWFRWIYDRVIAVLAWAHALVDPYKRRIKIWFKVFAPARASRTMRLLSRIRRRMATQV